MVLARDGSKIEQKKEELERLGLRYVIVCGEKKADERVVYREPRGKYDAINFGFQFVPEDTDIVALHDDDTRISGLEDMIQYFREANVALVYAEPLVLAGPQVAFYKILNALRNKVHVACSGELMLIRREVLERILPLRPCKAEDTYILFWVTAHRYRAIFCQTSKVETKRTKTSSAELEYKRINVAGIYQALSYVRPPILVRLFYLVLPFVAPLLMITGAKGYFWSKGILLGILDYLRGDRTGYWQPTYMESP